MVKLFCAVVGVGSVFPVDIDTSETVGHLKDKIKERKPNLIHFDADLLKLYIAKRGGSWLNIGSNDIKAVQRGETPDAIKVLMKERMVEARKLENRAYLGAGFTRVDDDIHILVELPAEPDELVKYNRWIDWLFAGQCVFVAAAVVLFAVVVWYGKSLTDQESCLVSPVPPFVCDCIGIVTITGLLVGLLQLPKAHFESKKERAYRRMGYEPIP